MKVLVISDYFHNLIKQDYIDYMKWSRKHLMLLGGYNVVLIDITFSSDKKYQSAMNLLHELMTKFEKPDLLRKKKLIVVVVCGAPRKDFKFDEIYDDQSSADDVYFHKNFSSYDILKSIIPAYMERVDLGEGKYIYSLASIPIKFYLERYKSVTTFLSYEYEPDSDECIDIIPLAKMRSDGDDCVAFEYKNGKSVVVVLPPYNKSDKKDAFRLLLKICNSYFKKIAGVTDLIERYVDDSIPQVAREAFTEALVCYSNDLYTSSLLMCRRTLEESAIHQGAKDKGFLRNKIEELSSKDLIDSNLKQIAIEIIEFGNWGAHPGKYEGEKITEDDVINVIEFLQIYFNYVYSLPKKLEKSLRRREQLNRKEKT